MNKKTQPSLGIIEGFFGRAWTMENRIDYAKFLAQHQLNFYIYAPKSDVYLRKLWQTNWPPNEKQSLLQLRDTYARHKIEFGIGLSPHEIYLDNSHNQRQQLRRRVKEINELTPDILCILFDDMRGDLPALAQIQTDIVHEVAELSTATRIIFCPTYYSFDPVLEKVFGTRPPDYWKYFRNHLDQHIDIFWTGEKVCSPTYSREHLQTINDALGRKIFLWDNYPVNDGAVKANHLHLRPVSESHSQISDLVAGHAMNPMNQAQLSKFAIASLTLAYAQPNNYAPDLIMQKILFSLNPPELAQQLIDDINVFQDQGLKNIDSKAKESFIQKYQKFGSNAGSSELIEWLQGGYTFDPACLTE